MREQLSGQEGTGSERLTAVLLQNIFRELAKRDWSMRMLAERSGLPYETVKKLLGGKIVRPSFVSVWQIAVALDCSLDDLSGRRDPAVQSQIVHKA